MNDIARKPIVHNHRSSDEPCNDKSAEILISIPVSELENVLRKLYGAKNPLVAFSENIEKMRCDAEIQRNIFLNSIENWIKEKLGNN